MKIVFIGDSITAAVPGVSFVDKVAKAYPQHEILNYGKGGDTVQSILTRLQEMRIASDIDVIFLLIGVNDVFVKTGWWHPTLKLVMKQPWVKNKQEFYLAYHKLIEFLLPYTKQLVLLPPLLVGEDLTNPSNQLLQEYFAELKELIERYQLPVLDVRASFEDYLKDKTPASYVPKRINQLRKDVLQLTTDALIDEASKKRHLYLTLDGVHLNTKGATLVFDAVHQYLKENQ
jgi:lysophospholipase L1-like esterase